MVVRRLQLVVLTIAALGAAVVLWIPDVAARGSRAEDDALSSSKVVSLLPPATQCDSTSATAGQPVTSIDAAKLFADDCAQCHAPDGHGLMLNQPNFTDPKWQASTTNGEMFKVIKFGREPMPFWLGSLSDDHINALVGYIRTLAKTGARPNHSTAGNLASASSRETDGEDSPDRRAEAPDSCYSCHQKQPGKIVALYEKSVHYSAGKSCNGCHGGDPTAADKDGAHSLNFTGKPNSDQAIRMCGQCHRKESIEYRASHHFSEDKRIRRADCVECHGAHTVGSPAPDFSYNLFCSGCHGLEYLPGLQEDFQNMLKLSDDLRTEMSELRESGKKPSSEILTRRREIRDLTGEIVHKTDLKGGSESIPHILELGQQLKQMIEREKAGK